MTIIYSIFVGIIGGFLWGKALEIGLQISLLVGGGVGIIIGILVSIFGKAARAGGNIQKGEANFVNNSLITIFGAFIIITGIIAWIIRAIFF